MKIKTFVLVCSLLAMTTSAFAQFFPANANISIQPGQVNAQVYNPNYEPIVCQGHTFGRTSRGLVLNAFFSDIIPPGQYRYAYVHTNPYDPFINGWSNINCQFRRYY
jgi:hypothetical protein